MTVTVPGFDISHWQGNPTFGSIPALYEFGMVKASEGTSYKDPQYLRNIVGLHNSGRLVGAYHFFTDDDPIAQARWFASIIGKQGKGYLPPVVDYEGLVLKLGAAEGARRLRAFISEVDRLTVRKCGIYLSDSTIGWFGGPLWAQITDSGSRFIWDARYGQPAAHDCNVQQTGQYGTIPGVGSGNVDTDEFRGTLTQLRRWALIYPVVNVKRLLRLTTPYMHGTDVLEVQRALIKRGYKIAADNVYGPNTAAAVAAFKRTVKWLPHNSIVGPGTRKALGI